jgi:hypothetical protein
VKHQEAELFRPIFVDDSGRRCSIVRVFGRVVAVASVGLVALSAAAFTVSPSVSAPRSRPVSAPVPIVAVDRATTRP